MMMRTFYLKLLVVCGLIAGLSWGAGRAQATSWLHAEGSQLVDSAGNTVILTGINWFGLETESYAPHGLWARNWESILDQFLPVSHLCLLVYCSNRPACTGSASPPSCASRTISGQLWTKPL